MPVLGKIALTVVTGGIALGALLGAAADPEMKRPPEQPWRGALQAPSTDDAAYRLVEAVPADVSPYRDSYAPSWADEELVDWEPAYPAWTYSDFGDETFAELAAADEPEAAEQPLEPEPAAPPEPEALAPEPTVAGGLAALY